MLLAALLFYPAELSAQKSDKPLNKDDVIGLLEGDVPPTRVADLARQHGIAFQMTHEAETDLRGAGADDGLIKTLRELAPKAARPQEPPASSPANAGAGSAVLVIQAKPGGAQVYIDDEPKATTSPEGRVRFGQLPAGQHAVRLSHAGYRDFEQKVELTAGQTATVYATLEAATGQASGGLTEAAGSTEARPSQGQSVPQKANREQAGIGLLVAPFQGPNGEKGAYVAGVAPRGPAERAGLRVGYVVMSIDGQPITSDEDLKEVVGAHRPGDTVRVAYSTSASGGGAVATATVQLGSLAALNQSSANLATFLVAHDHGLPAGQNLCVGWMSVANGMVHFRGLRALTNGVLGGPTHSFDISITDIKEARKNGVYLSNFMGFHIRLLKGTNANFFVVNAQGTPQPPDALLTAIDTARAKTGKAGSF